MAEIALVIAEFNKYVENGDFENAFGYLRENSDVISKQLRSSGIAAALKASTSDRLLLSFIDSVGFGERDISDSLVRLEKLLRVKPGVLVIAKAWGLGEIKKVDYFYRRITVDFKTKRAHQYAYEVAADSLEFPSDDHILVLRKIDPVRVEKLLKEKPGDFIKEMLKSYGDMPLLKIEKVAVENGFVKQAGWKKFWEEARAQLKKDKCVEIPIKKTDPVVLKAAAEDYGERWLIAFEHEIDPNKILAEVREFVACGAFASADEGAKAKICDRLCFAITAASNTDEALYARLACLVAELGFQRPLASDMRDYLWARHRYIRAAAALPAREVGAMVRFLACDDTAKAKLYASLPDFCFTAVSEIVTQFKDEVQCRSAVGDFLKQAKAPATLITFILGKYESFADWQELPQLLVLLTHAIALGEGRQGGETLRMQNIIRRLFADKAWLEKMLNALPDFDKIIFFERFQASVAWDHSTHHTIVVRMANFLPSLKERLVKNEKKTALRRVTSFRSYAQKKAEYFRLVNKDMPENVRRIEFAKGFGDLSENAEYQYAKDEQRQLMQKQATMQADLDAVKPFDFADASLEEVNPGVTVVLEGGSGRREFTILGEWDNDLKLGILSFKTRVAENMLGKRVGDAVTVPSSEGKDEEVKIVEIKPLSDEIKLWMNSEDSVAV